MPEHPNASRAVALARPHGAAVRVWGIVFAAAAAGMGLAAAVLLSGGGFLAALLSYSLGGSCFVAVYAAWLLVREALARLLRAASRRRAGGQLGRLAS
jgi:hypothetical protein